MLLLKDSVHDSQVPAAHPRSHNTSNVINDFIEFSPLCDLCGDKMASIPYTLQMTKAKKKNQKATNNGSKQSQFYDSCMGAENPTRYSSKMMNSIWGQYNELSVHNFKSLQCGGLATPEVQDSQNLQAQQMQQVGHERSPGAIRQFMGELGQAVSANFMENMHRY